MLEGLKTIPKITCEKPGGAFYLFPDVSAYIGGHGIKNDLDLANYLLEKYGLALVPGSAFGAPGFMRITYSASDEELDEGVQRLAKGLESLSGR